MYAHEVLSPADDFAVEGGGSRRDGLKQLLGFHGSLRRAIHRCRRLVDESSSPTSRARARDLAHFFSGPALWHDNDEEVLLLPLLNAYAEPCDRSRLDKIRDDHVHLEDAMGALVPALHALADGFLAPRPLAHLVHELERSVEEHLDREERVLYRIAETCLDRAQREALAASLQRLSTWRAP